MSGRINLDWYEDHPCPTPDERRVHESFDPAAFLIVLLSFAGCAVILAFKCWLPALWGGA